MIQFNFNPNYISQIKKLLRNNVEAKNNQSLSVQTHIQSPARIKMFKLLKRYFLILILIKAEMTFICIKPCELQWIIY